MSLSLVYSFVCVCIRICRHVCVGLFPMFHLAALPLGLAAAFGVQYATKVGKKADLALFYLDWSKHMKSWYIYCKQ